MCNFSGLTIGNYKGFIWQASRGNLPSPPQTWCTANALQSERSCSQGLRFPWPAILLCISPFLAQAPSFKAFFFGSLLPRLSPGSSVSLWEMEVRDFKDNFLLSELVLSTFPALIFFSLTPSNPQVHKTAGTFCSGLPQQ